MSALVAGRPGQPAPASVAVRPPSQLSDGRKVFAFAVMGVGFFIALLDIQIVSASRSPTSAAASLRAPTRSPGCRRAT